MGRCAFRYNSGNRAFLHWSLSSASTKRWTGIRCTTLLIEFFSPSFPNEISSFLSFPQAISHLSDECPKQFHNGTPIVGRNGNWIHAERGQELCHLGKTGKVRNESRFSNLRESHQRDCNDMSA